eukprot:tig00020675_g12673.t1
MESAPLPQRPPRVKRVRASTPERAGEPADSEEVDVPAGEAGDVAETGGKGPSGATIPDAPTEHHYEYLDHTADIQLHSWGATTEEAIASVIIAMMNYITDLDLVEIDGSLTRTVTASGHDMFSMLFAIMDEFLFIFSTEFFVAKYIRVVEFDRENWTITAHAQGETYDRSKHSVGTEVKAITYSAMQVHEKDERTDIYVIVDI